MLASQGKFAFSERIKWGQGCAGGLERLPPLFPPPRRGCPGLGQFQEPGVTVAEERERPEGPGAAGAEGQSCRSLVGPVLQGPREARGGCCWFRPALGPCSWLAPRPDHGGPWTEAGEAWLCQAVGWGEPGAKEKLLKCLVVAPSENPVLSKSPGLAA